MLERIEGPFEMGMMFEKLVQGRTTEAIWIAGVDKDKRLVEEPRQLFTGDNHHVEDNGDMMATAMAELQAKGAVLVGLAHNHPFQAPGTFNLNPSKPDLEITLEDEYEASKHDMVELEFIVNDTTFVWVQGMFSEAAKLGKEGLDTLVGTSVAINKIFGLGSAE